MNSPGVYTDAISCASWINKTINNIDLINNTRHTHYYKLLRVFYEIIKILNIIIFNCIKFFMFNI